MNVDMIRKKQYLLWFANENVDFRLPEIQSILQIFNIKIKWIEGPNESPFWVAELSSEEALQVASRSVTLHSIIELWGFGATAEELHQRVCSYPQEIIESCLDINSSFCVKVETFGKTFSMKEKVSKIESFNYLPAQGPVKLKDPDVSLFYIEYYGLEPLKAPKEAYNYFFGVWITDGQRKLISKFSLKTRKFIGNTSMDPQLSFIMANQALIKKGDLIIDPFVGTGSLLIAAAHFGAYVWGVDIDFLMLHGKTRPSRIQERSKPRGKDESIFTNLKQYKIGSQYLDVLVGDSSLPMWHEKLKIDSIITDPPYGIREATERIGSTKNYKISDCHLQGHIPSKIDYSLNHIYKDLLLFAAKHLKVGGRLVSWIPIYKKGYKPDDLPFHSCFKLIANSEQVLTKHTSRRLVSWEKICEPKNNDCDLKVAEMFSMKFREHYFGHGETRKQRKLRVALELEEKGLVNYSQNNVKNMNR